MNAGLAVIIFGGALMVIGAFISEWPAKFTERRANVAMFFVFMGSAFISVASLVMLVTWALGVS